MRRAGLLLVLLAAPAVCQAEEIKEKPFLVLDAGGNTGVVWNVLFTADGKQVITVSEDKTIRVEDVATGETRRVFRPPIGSGDQGCLYTAALSPDGRTLAVAGQGYTEKGQRTSPIFLLDLQAGRIERVLRGHTDAVIDLDFSTDGKRLASASEDHTARIWVVDKGECEQVLREHKDKVWGVAFSPDDKRLATAALDETGGRIWSVATGKVEVTLAGHKTGVTSVAWSPDGNTVATGGFDKTVRLWKTDGTLRRRLDGPATEVQSVVFTPDSRQLLYTWGAWKTPWWTTSDKAQDKSHGAALVEVETGAQRLPFSKHTGAVYKGALSRDGKLAATSGGSQRHEVYVWQTADGQVLQKFAGKGRALFSAAWHADNKTVAWGHTRTIPKDRDAVPLFQKETLSSFFHFADLRLGKVTDGQAKDWERARGEQGDLSLRQTGATELSVIEKEGNRVRARLRLPNNEDLIQCATLLPDGRVAVGSNLSLYLFQPDRQAQGADPLKPVRSFQGHLSMVWSVVPSPDGRYLLSASADQTVRIWKPDHDEPLLSLFVADHDWIAWTPEGYYAASPNGERLMGWQVNNGPDALGSYYPAEQFRASLYRPDVIQRVLETGNVAKALELADKARGQKSAAMEVAQVLPPKVTLTAPNRTGLKVTEPNLEIKAVAQSTGQHPVTAVQLLVDGRPLPDDKGLLTVKSPKLGEVSAAWTVPLTPGVHQLSVLARSAVSEGTSDDVWVIRAPARPDPKPPRPSLYVLAIGINTYPKESQQVKLTCATKDAETLSQTFQTKSKSAFERVETKVLTDAQATRQGIQQGLEWLRDKVQPDDVAVFFFAGHGDRDRAGAFYLLPVDVDPARWGRTALSGTELKKSLRELPCRRVLVMLDACHSGAIGHKSGIDELAGELKQTDCGVVVICAAMGHEKSLESPSVGHGYFTLAFLEGLSGKAGKNAEGDLQLTRLFAYVEERVQELSEGKQTPVVGRPTTIRSFTLVRLETN